MGLKIGLTGGIGSGKSYVAKVFKALGVPFYDADKEAKELMNTNSAIKNALILEFGKQVYDIEGHLDRAYLASQVFRDKERLDKLNAIVHPIVIQHGEDWALSQNFPYSLKEAALLFESGSYKKLDYTILVTAPTDMRIARVMQRDTITREEVLDRINKQLPDEEKQKLADFIIVNDGLTPLLPQILPLHKQFLEGQKT
ncbi:dephospho-CoA kinase [Sphingobacterium chuzhouense]|uniref:Dephospho-CoA kinase n=1 Tax=Sphingobacterium chuzhouense TaxID=1742264 RepID=A0ABR7XSS0_9SPHI|nr:dephospho-CoA kinase [Sphingobacterium chuzhouense]MBD1422193.1 dephospho-CoA kinase [Sphingobacterium chuzhouense]